VAKWLVVYLFFVSLLMGAVGGHSVTAADAVNPTVAAAPISTPTATADIPHFSVSVSPAKSTLNIGDKTQLTITYQWPAHAKVVSSDGEPDITKAVSDIFVTDIPPAQKFSSGQEERRVYTLTITAHRSGAWELPRPTLTIRIGNDTRSTVAPPVILQIGTEAAPAQLPTARAAWTRAQAPATAASSWWIIITLTFFMAVALLIFFLLRKRAQLIIRTPWDIFSDDWHAATVAADGKEAGARLSLALRRYVGALYQFDGPATTSKETIFYVKKHLSEDEHRQCAKLLEQIDALRWGPDDLPPSSVRPLMDTSRAWAKALQQRLRAEADALKKSGAAASTTAAATTGKNA
jgi:hypothetical protein